MKKKKCILFTYKSVNQTLIHFEIALNDIHET